MSYARLLTFGSMRLFQALRTQKSFYLAREHDDIKTDENEVMNDKYLRNQADTQVIYTKLIRIISFKKSH